MWMVAQVFLYGLITALATGLGALPFAFMREVSARTIAWTQAIASGLMLGASFGLILEGSAYGTVQTIAGGGDQGGQLHAVVGGNPSLGDNVPDGTALSAPGCCARRETPSKRSAAVAAATWPSSFRGDGLDDLPWSSGGLRRVWSLPVLQQYRISKLWSLRWIQR